MNAPRLLILLAAVLSGMTLSAGPTPAQQASGSGLKIEGAWARATPAAAAVGAGYLTIHNPGSAADALLGGECEAARDVQVHEMKHVQGMMQMGPVPKIEIGPGQTVTLKPGGFHLMLVGLKRPLKEGERLPLTLHFEHAGAVPVELVVAAVGAAGAPMAGHGVPMQPQPMQPMKH